MEAYLNLLSVDGVTVLCDVRRNPLSRKYGCSKRALESGCTAVGIRYAHLPQLGIAVAVAAFAALDGLRKVPEGALQIFGGIGTTWEHDIHFFVRRAATLCGLLGERSGFREIVAGHLASAS